MILMKRHNFKVRFGFVLVGIHRVSAQPIHCSLVYFCNATGFDITCILCRCLNFCVQTLQQGPHPKTASLNNLTLHPNYMTDGYSVIIAR